MKELSFSKRAIIVTLTSDSTQLSWLPLSLECASSIALLSSQDKMMENAEPPKAECLESSFVQREMGCAGEGRHPLSHEPVEPGSWALVEMVKFGASVALVS